jgi:hypothetical protein
MRDEAQAAVAARTRQHIEAARLRAMRFNEASSKPEGRRRKGAPHQIRPAVSTRPAPRRVRHGETAVVHGIGGRGIPT